MATSEYIPCSEVFEKLLELTANGRDSLQKNCEELGCSYSFMRRYIDEDSTRSARYARAKEDQADHSVDHIRALEQELLAKMKELEDPRLSNSLVQAYKLMVDDIKWAAGKLKPKKYNDKAQIELTGADGDAVRFELKTSSDKVKV